MVAPLAVGAGGVVAALGGGVHAVVAVEDQGPVAGDVVGDAAAGGNVTEVAGGARLGGGAVRVVLAPAVGVADLAVAALAALSALAHAHALAVLANRVSRALLAVLGDGVVGHGAGDVALERNVGGLVSVGCEDQLAVLDGDELAVVVVEPGAVDLGPGGVNLLLLALVAVNKARDDLAALELDSSQAAAGGGLELAIDGNELESIDALVHSKDGLLSLDDALALDLERVGLGVAGGGSSAEAGAGGEDDNGGVHVDGRGGSQLLLQRAAVVFFE